VIAEEGLADNYLEAFYLQCKGINDFGEDYFH
jgi:hypothetical protein